MQPPVSHAEPLLILGASVRAAAFSASRGGLQPMAIDLFGDTDLRSHCKTRQVIELTDKLVQIADSFPPAPWMYTGGLENRPRIIRALCEKRRLLGNRADIIRRIRNPFRLAKVLIDHQLRFPATTIRRPAASDTGWLDKPIRSSGGHGIRFVGSQSQHAGNRQASDRRCYQRFIAGPTYSGLYLAASGQATLVGVTRQLVGQSWTGASGYQYCGSVGPLELDRTVREQFHQIGDCLASSFQLTGLFGVDAIVADGEVWPVEVNPRFPASAELYDWCFATSVVRWHVDACRNGRRPAIPAHKRGQCFGKAIVYAPADLLIGPKVPIRFRRCNDDDTWPTVADIPAAGQRIRAKAPLVTVFANGLSPEDVTETLRQNSAQAIRLLH